MDILAFWKANAFYFPHLSRMAKDLTVQASSVSAERAFSSGTDLVTADRCSLKGGTIEKTQFLKFNL
jgi:hAT family C-terminal dimerisation region